MPIGVSWIAFKYLNQMFYAAAAAWGKIWFIVHPRFRDD